MNASIARRSTAPLRARRRRDFDLEPGTRVGRYAIVDRLSYGGFGAVYAARGDDGRDAALKVLHADLSTTDDAMARFAREIAAVRRIKHPHVIDIRDVGRTPEGRPYFAMELLRGADLHRLVAEGGRLAPAAALDVLGPVCSALAAAHARGIVHRDVKPANVFVTRPDRRVVLLDFGVAKLLDCDLRLTTSRQRVGTPAYMAPEQDGGVVDARADVYGLGSLAFFALTGSAPFAGGSDSVLVYLHRHARRQRATMRAPLPAAVDDVLARAMHPSPDERYAGPLELLAELRRACGRPAATAASDRLSIACRIEIEVADGTSAVDAALAANRALRRARARLDKLGFSLALDACRSQLWVRPLAGDPARALAALDDERRAFERAADPTVRVQTAARVGEATWEHGAPVGGPLVELWTWEAT